MKHSVLVTGAAGFIGSHLAERLLQSGYRVVGLDNFDEFYPPAMKRENAGVLQAYDNFKMVEGDIREACHLEDIFRNNDIEIVFHLAARAGVRPSLEQPLLYESLNVGGTVNLLEFSRTHGVRQFLFASSSSVYGINGKAPFKESETGYPISPYAASKAAAELFCRTYSYLYHLPVVVLRLFTVYGPRQRPEMAIHRFTRLIEQGEEVILFGDSAVKRDYTYVDDIVAGFEGALALRDGTYRVFNLGRGNAVDLRFLLSLIESALGKRARTRSLAMQPGEVPLTLADITKARSLLGYEPKTSVEEGIPRFVRWYLEKRR